MCTCVNVQVHILFQQILKNDLYILFKKNKIYYYDIFVCIYIPYDNITYIPICKNKLPRKVPRKSYLFNIKILYICLKINTAMSDQQRWAITILKQLIVKFLS